MKSPENGGGGDKPIVLASQICEHIGELLIKLFGFTRTGYYSESRVYMATSKVGEKL